MIAQASKNVIRSLTHRESELFIRNSITLKLLYLSKVASLILGCEIIT